MKIKDLQKDDKEYYVINGLGEMFAGLKGGNVIWTNKTNEAKPLYDLRQFKSFQRYYSWLEPKIIFL